VTAETSEHGSMSVTVDSDGSVTLRSTGPGFVRFEPDGRILVDVGNDTRMTLSKIGVEIGHGDRVVTLLPPSKP
jgi:hypothetical protein